ncbi:hypothetical protein N496_04625 [Clostridium botulinum A2B3 87]|uniref:hypothetical protein n=1 Tax=Clostridium botulinum TaxID=1491 RepID=UPI0004A55B0B|nr:hypothetical protein [Clostridium botulinum]KEI98885.1 hypothetical protein N496_04625 [Clostridium botulinum A2B3 87]
MYYRNDEQNINRDEVESSNENFYNEAYDYPTMNFSPMMYDPLMCTPQAMPTMAEYDNDDYDDPDDPDDEFDDYELMRSPHARRRRRRRRHIHHHFHHHFFHVPMRPWWMR